MPCWAGVFRRGRCGYGGRRGEEVHTVVSSDYDPASPLHHEPCGNDAAVIGDIGDYPSLASDRESGVASDVLAEDVGEVVLGVTL